LARRWKQPITLDEVPPRDVLFANYPRACSSAGRIWLYEKREIRGLRPFTLELRLAGLVVVLAVLAETPNGGARSGLGVTLAAKQYGWGCRCAFLFCTQIRSR
jgi:hypothetical protein